MHNRTYVFFKSFLFGPFLRLWNRPKTEGMEHIAETGPVLFASNHLSVMDSFYLPLVVDRQIVFLAKKEYFTQPGLKGRIKAWFFKTLNQVPIDRESADAAYTALKTAERILKNGDVLAMYPEGTRSPDGRLYKGKTGIARLSIETGVPVTPVAMINTTKANPLGTVFPRPVKVGVKVAEPIEPTDFEGDVDTRARAMTNAIIDTLQEMSGQEYVPDFYAAQVKESLEAGLGYPEGSEPGAAQARAEREAEAQRQAEEAEAQEKAEHGSVYNLFHRNHGENSTQESLEDAASEVAEDPEDK